MSYIGIENLQTLVPYYCVRNWLPDTQANLKWTNKKLWRYVSITSIASQALAEKYNKNKISLYICGLLFQLGIMVILTSCATIYDDIRTFWLKKASESNDENIQDAVLACDLPRQFVYENTLNKASLFNWQLLELMHFEDSKITKVLKELHQTGNYSDLSEETAMIARASCFAKVIMMEEQHKLYPQDRELICNYYQLDDEEMLLLRDLNYHQLDIA